MRARIISAGIIFYTTGSRNGLEGSAAVGTNTQEEVDPKRHTFTLIEEYVEDVKQDQQSVPDMLEWIMKPPGLVEAELRMIFMKIG